MADAVLSDRIGQRRGNVALSNQRVKLLRPVSESDDLVLFGDIHNGRILSTFSESFGAMVVPSDPKLYSITVAAEVARRAGQNDSLNGRLWQLLAVLFGNVSKEQRSNKKKACPLGGPAQEYTA